MTLEETLKTNKERYRIRLEEQRKRAKKEEIKNNILFGLISGFILTITSMLLININNNFINDCMSAGYSQSYCERGM